MYSLNVLLIFCLLVFCPLDGFAKMYKWADENGKIHFTDQPPPEEATEIKEYGKDGTKNEPKSEPKEAESKLTLKDVDLITMGGFIRDGVLNIGFHYKNRDIDKLIFWEEGTVTCQCEIYEDVGKRGRKKGQKIGSISKELKHHDQDIYFDVPDKYLNKGGKGIVECLVDTGYMKKKVSWNPSFGGTRKDTPGGKIRGGATSQTVN